MSLHGYARARAARLRRGIVNSLDIGLGCREREREGRGVYKLSHEMIISDRDERRGVRIYRRAGFPHQILTLRVVELADAAAAVRGGI